MSGRLDKSIPDGFRPLKGDASSRRYYRGDEGILVDYPASMANTFDNFLFWHGRYRSAGLPVPHIIRLFPEKLQMLLEDWGDQDGVKVLGTLSSTEKRRTFVQAVMQLAEQVPRLADGVAEFLLPPVPVQKELAFTLEHAKDTLFNDHDLGWLEALCREVAEKLRRLPEVLAHRDFHLRNILVRDQNLCIIDFQDTRRAPDGYDSASLLFDNYADLSDISRDLFSGLDEPDFRWVALQRSLKALGTFCYFGLKLKKHWFRSSIHPAMTHVQDHLRVLSREKELEKWNQLMRTAKAVIQEDD